MRYIIMMACVMAVSACVPPVVSAGPILDSARLAAAQHELAVASQGLGEATYRKSGGRKWVEWLGIVGGAVALLATQERCDGIKLSGDRCLGETSWPAGQIAATAGVLTVALVSKMLPDPE